MSLIRLDTVQSRPLQWLWYPRFPLGALSILFGHADRGKSVMALTCASHISRQRPWPDGQPCSNGTTIILEAEDSLEQTVVPRLKAAGADLTRIFTYRERNLHDLPKHIAEVTPSLVILSPLTTFLPKLTNTWNDKSVRDALQPLADLAAHVQTAMVAIMHCPKRYQGIPVHQIGGSVAFGAVARSVLMVERTPDDLFLVEAAKHNLVKQVPPIGYRLNASPADPTIPVLTWELVKPTFSLIPPDEEVSSIALACEYLRMALHDGPESSTDIHFGAEKQGISDRTLKRARKMLGVVARQVPAGSKSHWELSLPSQSAT